MADERQRTKLAVFISYSRADEKFADELRLGLEDRDYAVEIDKHSIRQGEEWKARLSKLIAGSDTVVVHAEVSPHLHRTLQAIRARGPITRVELAEITGLTPPAVANIRSVSRAGPAPWAKAEICATVSAHRTPQNTWTRARR